MTDVKNGDLVRIHYTAKLTDGTAIDSTQDREPLELQVGAGEVISGLDRQLEGMTVGETRTVMIPAVEAYGAHDDAQVHRVPLSAIPDGVEVGSGLRGTAPDGRQTTFTVTGMDGERVTIDANHPLAGKDLECDITVIDIVQPQTAKEA